MLEKIRGAATAARVAIGGLLALQVLTLSLVGVLLMRPEPEDYRYEIGEATAAAKDAADKAEQARLHARQAADQAEYAVCKLDGVSDAARGGLGLVVCGPRPTRQTILP